MAQPEAPQSLYAPRERPPRCNARQGDNDDAPQRPVHRRTKRIIRRPPAPEHNGTVSAGASSDNDGRSVFEQFRAFPAVCLEDPELTSSHIDVLLTLMIFVDAKNSKRDIFHVAGIDSRLMSQYTQVHPGNIGTRLRELRELGYLVTAYQGKRISDVRWNLNKAGVSPALKWRAKWAKAPKPVIQDQTLLSNVKHAYIALRWLNFTLSEKTKSREVREQFYVARGLLAEVMHVHPDSAKRYLKELERLHLIEYREGKTLKGIRPMQFVPLALRYAHVEARMGQRRGHHRYPIRDDMEAAVARWRESGYLAVDDRHLS